MSEPKKNKKEICLEFLMGKIRLLKSQEGVPFAIFQENDKRTIVRMPSQQFLERIRLILTEIFIPSSLLLNELQEHMTAVARYQSPEEEVFIRFRRLPNQVVIDLADPLGRAVLITGKSIRILDNPKSHFYHPQGQLALEEYLEPTGLEGFKKLKKYLGKISIVEAKLIISWLVAVIYTEGPYPILLLQGEQGTAKTFAMKILRSLLDPVSSPVRALSSNERDFIIMAYNNVVLPFDNISGLKPWMSDAFCRIASGGGFSLRKLYSDDEEITFNLCRPFVLNGIPDFVTKNDLADRVILIMMKNIPPNERKTEKELLEAFESDKPEILGALFNAVSYAIANTDLVILNEYPRMADFAKVGCAIAPVLNWTQKEFMAAYQNNINFMSSTCLEADEVAMAVLEFIQVKKQWKGTATKLLAELNVRNSERAMNKFWPRTASQLSSRIRSAAPALRGKGVGLTYPRTSKARGISLDFRE